MKPLLSIDLAVIAFVALCMTSVAFAVLGCAWDWLRNCTNFFNKWRN